MAFEYLIKYKDLTDREIIEMTLTDHRNEEAVAFLLYNRYSNLLHSVYYGVTGDRDQVWFDDCVDELFIHLKGKDYSWSTLSSFGWRSTFGCWLKKVAERKFLEVSKRLIENGGKNTSIDANDDDPDGPAMQIPIDEEELRLRQCKAMLMEAIQLLKDDDQRFVIIKYLEGYSSKEIAILLQKRWEKHGIVKYGYKKNSKVRSIVVPDAGYVDVRPQRAKENLRKIMDEQ